MAKTIKQIADEIGVSKTAVRKKIGNLGLSDKLQTNGNRILVNERQETLIKSEFEKKEPKTGNRKLVCEKTESLQLVSDMYFALVEQLKEKDRQIAEKDKQIEYLQFSLKSTTEALALAQESVKASQLLQVNTERKILELETKQEQESETETVSEIEKKSWWKKLFG